MPVVRCVERSQADYILAVDRVGLSLRHPGRNVDPQRILFNAPLIIFAVKINGSTLEFDSQKSNKLNALAVVTFRVGDQLNDTHIVGAGRVCSFRQISCHLTTNWWTHNDQKQKGRIDYSP